MLFCFDLLCFALIYFALLGFAIICFALACYDLRRMLALIQANDNNDASHNNHANTNIRNSQSQRKQ